MEVCNNGNPLRIGIILRVAFVVTFMFVISTCCLAFATPFEVTGEPQVGEGGQIDAGVPSVGPTLKLPDAPVHMFLREGQESRFELFFIDARYGWDIEDYKFYKVWCLESRKPFHKNAMHLVRLYSSYSSDLPSQLKGMDFNRINYIINHKPQPYSKKAVQQAIWYFTDYEKSEKLSDEAVAMIEEAKEKGKDYVPGDGELIAVVVLPDIKKQAAFIEVPVPPAVMEVAPAAFIAPLVPAAGGWLLPLPLLPLLALDHHSSPPSSPPNHHHQISEPDVLALLTVGVYAVVVVRRRKR